MTEYQIVVQQCNKRLEDGTLSPELSARLAALLDIVKAAPFWARNRVWRKVMVFVDVMVATREEKADAVD